MCARCNENSEETQGTAYFYKRGPQQTKQVPTVPDGIQEARVTKTLTCIPGVNSWGAVKADRALDLRGVVGVSLLGIGALMATVGALMTISDMFKQKRQAPL